MANQEQQDEIDKLCDLLRGLETKERQIQAELRSARALAARLQSPREAQRPREARRRPAEAAPQPQPPQERPISVGDRVRVRNPKKDQLKVGRVDGFTRTGLARVTGIAPDGTIQTIRRASSNLTIVQ